MRIEVLINLSRVTQLVSWGAGLKPAGPRVYNYLTNPCMSKYGKMPLTY